jgi:hypothetical protein
MTIAHIYTYYLYHNIILCIYCVYYIIHIVVSSFESLLQDATKALAYGPNGAAYGISQAQWDHGRRRPSSTIGAWISRAGLTHWWHQCGLGHARGRLGDVVC